MTDETRTIARSALPLGSSLRISVSTNRSNARSQPRAFARTALLHALSSAGFACSRVFTREEVNLSLDRISADTDGSMKDERLPVLLNRRVPGILKVAVVECQIHVDAAHVLQWLSGQNELRHSSTDDHKVIALLAQQANQFEQHRMGGLNEIARVVAKCYRHRGLMTSSRIADAASSPRPLICIKSK